MGEKNREGRAPKIPAPLGALMMKRPAAVRDSPPTKGETLENKLKGHFVARDNKCHKIMLLDHYS